MSFLIQEKYSTVQCRRQLLVYCICCFTEQLELDYILQRSFQYEDMLHSPFLRTALKFWHFCAAFLMHWAGSKKKRSVLVK